MSTRTKSVLILLGTLMIGAAIGVIGSGILRSSRWERSDRMDSGKRFLRIVEKIVQPDEKQKAAVQKVVEKYSGQLGEIRERHQCEIFSVLDSMRSELDTLLTGEQKKQLKEYYEKITKRSIGRRVAVLTKTLNLNEEQRKQIENIFREGEIFFSQNRRVSGENQEKMEKIHQEIEKILTPGQIETYRELKERQPYLFEAGFRSEEGRGKRGKAYDQ